MKTFTQLFIALMVCFPLSCVNNNQLVKEVFYIPDNYRGHILIIYDVKNGAPKEYLKDARLFKVPPSGILLTQFDQERSNLLDNEYYYYRNGKKTKLELASTDSIYSNHDTTVMIKNIMGFNSFQKTFNHKELIYCDIYIGSINAADSSVWIEHQIRKVADSIYSIIK